MQHIFWIIVAYCRLDKLLIAHCLKSLLVAYCRYERLQVEAANNLCDAPRRHFLAFAHFCSTPLLFHNYPAEVLGWSSSAEWFVSFCVSDWHVPLKVGQRLNNFAHRCIRSVVSQDRLERQNVYKIYWTSFGFINPADPNNLLHT